MAVDIAQIQIDVRVFFSQRDGLAAFARRGMPDDEVQIGMPFEDMRYLARGIVRQYAPGMAENDQPVFLRKAEHILVAWRIERTVMVVRKNFKADPPAVALYRLKVFFVQIGMIGIENIITLHSLRIPLREPARHAVRVFGVRREQIAVCRAPDHADVLFVHQPQAVFDLADRRTYAVYAAHVRMRVDHGYAFQTAEVDKFAQVGGCIRRLHTFTSDQSLSILRWAMFSLSSSLIFAPNSEAIGPPMLSIG